MRFSDWLTQEIERRGMTQASLARASGLREGTLSRILSGQRMQPSPDTLNKLAKGLNLSPATLFVAAGMLPADGNVDSITDNFINLFESLGELDQTEIVELMRLKLSLRQPKEYREL